MRPRIGNAVHPNLALVCPESYSLLRGESPVATGRFPDAIVADYESVHQRSEVVYGTFHCCSFGWCRHGGLPFLCCALVCCDLAKKEAPKQMPCFAWAIWTVGLLLV